MKIVTITTISKRKFDFSVKDDVCHKTLINNIKSEGIILEDNNKTTAINPDYIETIEIEPDKAESDLKGKDAFQKIVISAHSLGGEAELDSKGDILIRIGGKEFGRISISDVRANKPNVGHLNATPTQFGYTELNI
ncbi:hypothetical protein KF282_0887 [Lactococcus lactis subsp. lactis]|jgi:hypothetical protein|uniref:Uncharacterized protein n=1 Tax=Lactococcus lactis subsp. lactis TaxID=1360 RepID=A0A0V8CZI8_LACLL|nr:hypothetical protein [Lactococcus lactis]KSU06730.1 hypothetical protein KF282_0887 [Lactococcus lactis subsp. lactis]